MKNIIYLDKNRNLAKPESAYWKITHEIKDGLIVGEKVEKITKGE